MRLKIAKGMGIFENGKKNKETARYGKWQDELTSDINYEIERGL